MNEIKFNTIEEAIEDFKNGRPIIVADDEDRENEGDVIIPAQFATPQVINFLISECKGVVCLSLTREKAQKLGLSEMVSNNTDPKGTAFTQSIDAVKSYGVSTGVSAKQTTPLHSEIKKLITSGVANCAGTITSPSFSLSSSSATIIGFPFLKSSIAFVFPSRQ